MAGDLRYIFDGEEPVVLPRSSVRNAAKIIDTLRDCTLPSDIADHIIALLEIHISEVRHPSTAPVAQLAEASDSSSEGSGFDSRPGHPQRKDQP